MGWIRRLIAVITCTSCKTTDERTLKQRNRLRSKVGKNKIVPLAPTDMEFKTEGEEIIPKGSPTPTDERGDDLISEDKWAGPRTPSKTSIASDTALSLFALNYVKTIVIPGAISRFLAEQQQNACLASSSASGGTTDMSINESVTDLVQESLTNAEKLLREEQESRMDIAQKHPQAETRD